MHIFPMRGTLQIFSNSIINIGQNPMRVKENKVFFILSVDCSLLIIFGCSSEGDGLGERLEKQDRILRIEIAMISFFISMSSRHHS